MALVIVIIVFALAMVGITRREVEIYHETGSADQASARTQWPAGIAFTVVLVVALYILTHQ